MYDSTDFALSRRSGQMQGKSKFFPNPRLAVIGIIHDIYKFEAQDVPVKIEVWSLSATNR